MLQIIYGFSQKNQMDEFFSNTVCVNGSDCRAAKIISNDTKLETISWELNAANPIFIVCVGVRVGGHPRENFSQRLKDVKKSQRIEKTPTQKSYSDL